jgi:hypothetical protein
MSKENGIANTTKINALILKAFLVEMRRAFAWAIILFCIVFIPLKSSVINAGKISFISFSAFLPFVVLSFALVIQICMSFRILSICREMVSNKKFDWRKEIDDQSNWNDLVSKINLEMKRYTFVSFEENNQKNWIGYSKYNLTNAGQLIFVVLSEKNLENSRRALAVSSVALLQSLLSDNKQNVENVQSIANAIR